LEVLGRRRARITVGSQLTTLSPRHSEIAVLLMLQPAGLSAKQLGHELYGPRSNPITVRAEVSRLRHSLGGALASNPYRFEADLDSDWGLVERLLQRGDVAQAAEHYPGPLLVGSGIPAIEAARSRTAKAMKRRAGVIATPLQPQQPGDTRRAQS
jgi:hypothetical protein